MKIETTTREVTDYRFTLTTDQLAAMLADPIAWADQLRAELNWQAPLEPTPPPARKNGKGKAKRTPKAAAARKPRAGGATPKEICQFCQREIAAKFLPRHMAAKHPDQLASSPA